MADYKLKMTGAQIDERLQITKMPNPNALTFTGGVSVSYDGSEEKTIEIPKAFSGSWNDLTDRPFYKQGEQVVPIPDEYMPKDYINRLIDARLDASLGEVAELIGGDA